MEKGRYGDLFVGEMRELIERVVGVLGSADAESRPADVDELFRCFHSMKGMAASMEVTAAADLADAAEDLLEAARAGAGFRMEWAVMLQRAAERLDAMIDSYSAGAPVAGGEEVAALMRMAAAGAEVRSGAASAEPGVQRKGASPVLRIEVGIDTAARMPAARAFMVIRKLAGIGRVCGSEPSENELKNPASRPSSVAVLMADEPADYEIRTVLSAVPEIELLSIASIGMHDRPGGGKGRGLPVRIRPELLDRMQELGGELFFICRQFESLRPGSAAGKYEDALRTFRRTVKDLQQVVTDARLVPLNLVTAAMPMKVREIAARLGKNARMEISGDSIGIDRAIAERLEAPLTHLMRNALDHGIETPGARAAAGKPECGLISVVFSRTDRGLRVVFSDDGRGVDVKAIRKTGIERGLIAASGEDGKGGADLMEMLFLPGFSTVKEPTEFSGRGVGLDAVRRSVGEIGGRVAVESEDGRGCRFTLEMPVSFLQMHALVVETGGGAWAIPIPHISGIVSSRDLSPAGDGGMFMLRGEKIKVMDLSALLRLDGGRKKTETVRPWMILLESGGRKIAVGTDAVLGESQLVLRQLGAPLNLVRGLSGYSILPDGRPVLTLDVVLLAGGGALEV